MCFHKRGKSTLGFDGGDRAGSALTPRHSRQVPVRRESEAGGLDLPPWAVSSQDPSRWPALTFSSPVATLKTSSTTQPTARRAAPDEWASFHVVSLSTCEDTTPAVRPASLVAPHPGRVAVQPGAPVLGL